jgi:hypothetical protein
MNIHIQSRFTCISLIIADALYFYFIYNTVHASKKEIISTTMLLYDVVVVASS